MTDAEHTHLADVVWIIIYLDPERRMSEDTVAYFGDLVRATALEHGCDYLGEGINSVALLPESLCQWAVRITVHDHNNRNEENLPTKVAAIRDDLRSRILHSTVDEQWQVVPNWDWSEQLAARDVLRCAYRDLLDPVEHQLLGLRHGSMSDDDSQPRHLHTIADSTNPTVIGTYQVDLGNDPIDGSALTVYVGLHPDTFFSDNEIHDDALAMAQISNIPILIGPRPPDAKWIAKLAANASPIPPLTLPGVTPLRVLCEWEAPSGEVLASKVVAELDDRFRDFGGRRRES